VQTGSILCIALIQSKKEKSMKEEAKYTRRVAGNKDIQMNIKLIKEINDKIF